MSFQRKKLKRNMPSRQQIPTGKNCSMISETLYILIHLLHAFELPSRFTSPDFLILPIKPETELKKQHPEIRSFQVHESWKQLLHSVARTISEVSLSRVADYNLLKLWSLKGRYSRISMELCLKSSMYFVRRFFCSLLLFIESRYQMKLNGRISSQYFFFFFSFFFL